MIPYGVLLFYVWLAVGEKGALLLYRQNLRGSALGY